MGNVLRLGTIFGTPRPAHPSHVPPPLKVSRGYLRKLIGKMSDALKPCYDELLAALPDADTLNIDETGHIREIDKDVDTATAGQDIARTLEALGFPRAK